MSSWISPFYAYFLITAYFLCTETADLKVKIYKKESYEKITQEPFIFASK